MRIFRDLLIGLVAIAIYGCNYSKNVSLLLGGKLDRKHFVQEIPFEYRKGLIVIKARVNADSTPREFIFDTGAFNSKIEVGLAQQHHLQTIATKENSTAQGNSKLIEVVRIDSLQIGETFFRNIGAGKVEYSAHSASPCIARYGIIGANLIKLANWKIDYHNQKIFFSDRSFEIDDEALKIEFERPVLSSTPKVELMIEENTIAGILFDTGFNGGLILPSSLSAGFNSDSATYLDQSTTGIYGSNIDTLVEKHLRIQLGSNRTLITVAFSSLGKGLIGNDILEHFEVTLDNQNNEISLKQKSDIEIEKSFEMIPGILNDSMWVINRIKLNSNLELNLGDTLISINGYRPNELFISQCEYFMGIGEFLHKNSHSFTFCQGCH